MSGLRVLRPGPLALVQDLGRPGFAAVGVGRSGALDRGALRLGNRLLGNPESDAGIECHGGGGQHVREIAASEQRCVDDALTCWCPYLRTHAIDEDRDAPLMPLGTPLDRSSEGQA